jgi:hypothetical protein
MFSASIRIRNKKPYDTSGIIYAGTVIETLDPFSGVQNLAVAQNVSFTVPAGQVQVVSVPAWCLNKNYKPPGGTPMRMTSLAAPPYGSQDEAWADMGRRR